MLAKLEQEAGFFLKKTFALSRVMCKEIIARSELKLALRIMLSCLTVKQKVFCALSFLTGTSNLLRQKCASAVSETSLRTFFDLSPSAWF